MEIAEAQLGDQPFAYSSDWYGLYLCLQNLLELQGRSCHREDDEAGGSGWWNVSPGEQSSGGCGDGIASRQVSHLFACWWVLPLFCLLCVVDTEYCSPQ